MAEAIAKYVFGAKSAHGFGSAGISAYPAEEMSPNAQNALKKLNVPFSSHSAIRLSAELLGEYDLILTMTASQCEIINSSKARTLCGFTGSGRDIPDPFGGSQADYDRCAKDILKAIKLLRKKIVEA